MTALNLVTLVTLLGSPPSTSSPTSSSQVRLAPKTTAPKPIVVLMELNPWLMVIGSDSATFALYEDGRVIYRSHDAEGRPSWYLTAVLPDAERRAFVGALKLNRLNGLSSRFETSNGTDLPTTVIFTWPNKKLHGVSVYGVVDTDQNHQVLATTIQLGASPPPVQVPKEFVDVYRRLHTFSSASATRWVPEVIELMVSGYENAPTSRPWPKGWPDLTNASFQPTSDTAGVIFVDGRDQDALFTFLESLGEKEAIVMNGKKVAVSVRLVIPGEELWAPDTPASH